MTGNGLDDPIGKVPSPGHEGPRLGMIIASDLSLSLRPGLLVRLVLQILSPVGLVFQHDVERCFPHVVQQASHVHFVARGDAMLAGNPVTADGGGQGVLPQGISFEQIGGEGPGEDVARRQSKDDTFYGLVSQVADGFVQRRGAPVQAIVGGIDHAQEHSGHPLIHREDAAQIRARRVWIADQCHRPRGYLRQGGDLIKCCQKGTWRSSHKYHSPQVLGHPLPSEV